MEQMPYYLPPEEGWKKHFEGLIPILILVLIAVVLIGKTTNYFCAAPVLSDIFCKQGTIKVGLLGDFTTGADTEVKATIFYELLQEKATKSNIEWSRIPSSAIEYAQANTLKEFDVVAVAGKQELTYHARQALGEYIGGGGKVMLMGDAGVRDPDDKLIAGWGAASFGDYAPVELNLIGETSGGMPRKLITDAQLFYFESDNAYLGDYARSYQLNFTLITDRPECHQINALDVVQSGGSNLIAILESADQSKSVLAIVDKPVQFGNGKVVYFNYDPGCTWDAALTTIGYLSGKPLTTTA